MEKQPILAMTLIVPILVFLEEKKNRFEKIKRTCSVAEVQRRGSSSHSATAKSSGSALQEFFNFLLPNNSVLVRARGQHPVRYAFVISSIHLTDTAPNQLSFTAMSPSAPRLSMTSLPHWERMRVCVFGFLS